MKMKCACFLGLVAFSQVGQAELRWDQSAVNDLWLTSMLSQGKIVTDALPPSSDPNGFAQTYYDLTNTLISTIEYCDELSARSATPSCQSVYSGYSRSTWAGLASKAYRSYFDGYVYPNAYKLPARWRFTDGVRKLIDLKSRDVSLGLPQPPADVLAKMRDEPSYSQLGEHTRNNDTWDVALARPVAYVLEAHINAEKSGLARNDVMVDLLVNILVSHFEQWRAQTSAVNVNYTTLDNSKTWSFSSAAVTVKPFMSGLAARALQAFYDWELANNRLNAHSVTSRIPSVMADFYLFLAKDAKVVTGNRSGGTYNQRVGESMWQQNAGSSQGQSYGAFYYSDRDYQDPTNSALTDSVYHAADLNMLIAPAYAWLAVHYKNTDPTRSAELLSIGDNIFMSGIYGRYIVQGKQFSQHYRWSIDYLKYRSDALDGASSLPLAPTGFGANPG